MSSIALAKRKISENLFGFSAVSICVGVLGGLSALVTMFVDVNQTVSVKWLLFVMTASCFIFIVLLKSIHDVARDKTPEASHEKPIRFVEHSSILVIRRNENFLNNIVVGCYTNEDDLETLAYVGVVHLIQEKIIQIKIVHDLGIFGKYPLSAEDLSKIVIKSVVPATTISYLSGGSVER
jgi:hypothetical protein